MLGVLLESRARRSRRSGGAALSVAVHVAIIGAVTAATAHVGPESREHVQAVTVRFSVPLPTPRPAETQPTQARVSPFAAPITVPRIAVPTSVPTTLPQIQPVTGMSLDSLIIGSVPRGPRSGGGLLDVDDRSGAASNEWRGADLFMRIVTLAKPRYPENLRQAGIDGRVLVRFTVDTLGRIDPASVRVIESTHELFTRAVRDILPVFRFKPAEVGGRRVPALAEMPFEFSIAR